MCVSVFPAFVAPLPTVYVCYSVLYLCVEFMQFTLYNWLQISHTVSKYVYVCVLYKLNSGYVCSILCVLSVFVCACMDL